jgi:hypothetical protein
MPDAHCLAMGVADRYFVPADFFAPVRLCGSAAFGGLPMTPFSGQILNAGHFSQPATTAIGHSVIAILPFVPTALSYRTPGACDADRA